MLDLQRLEVWRGCFFGRILNEEGGESCSHDSIKILLLEASFDTNHSSIFGGHPRVQVGNDDDPRSHLNFPIRFFR